MNIALPQIPAQLTISNNLAAAMKSDETISLTAFKNQDISGLKVKSCVVNESMFDKILFTQAKLEKLGFTDVATSNCDLTAASFPESSWRRVSTKDTRATGLQIQNSTLQDITFLNCKLNLSNWRFTKLKNIRFSDCILDEADFYMATLENVDFQNCSLEKAQFSASTLKNADFRTSNISNLFGIESLSGAIIDSTQLVSIAPLLANAANIIVSD